MSDDKQHREEDDQDLVTREHLDLRLSGFRSEMRLLFVVAIAGNQVLAHLQLSSVAGYIGSGLAVAGAVAAKIFLVR